MRGTTTQESERTRRAKRSWRAVQGDLGRAVQGRLQSQGLTPYDVAWTQEVDCQTIYRAISGATANPRLGTLLAICHATRTDPTTLLELACCWPAATQTQDALDHALLTAQQRLEALSPEHKQWALAVVQALLAGAPSLREPAAAGVGMHRHHRMGKLLALSQKMS